MRVSTCSLLASALALGASGASAQYFEVFSEAEAQNGEAPNFLDTSVVDGSSVYALIRASGAGTSGPDGLVTRVDGAPDATSVTTIMTPAQWSAATTVDLGGFLGAAVTPMGNLRFVNFFDNNVWEINTTTGAPSVVIASTAFDAHTGGSANLSASNVVLADGSGFVYDGDSDSILNFTSTGTISTVVTDAQLSALTGSDILSGTGLALVGDDLYFGSNAADALYKWDTANNVGSLVLSEAQLEAPTDDVDGNAGIDDIFAAPDGLIYIYEDDSDYIMSFDPADPAGTLSVVLTEAQLNAGPASDSVAQFQWFDGNIAWTDQSDGFYSVPEPATAALLGLGGLAMLRRRSA